MKNKKLLSVVVFLSPFLMMAAENNEKKELINYYVQEWILPILLLVIIGGVMYKVISDGPLSRDGYGGIDLWKAFKYHVNILIFSNAILVGVAGVIYIVINSICLQ